MPGFLSKLLSLGADKELKEFEALTNHISSLAPKYVSFEHEDFCALTNDFRQQLEVGATLDDILPDAFAAVREASDQVLGMRHFDVQVMGAIALHRGMIAEMKTGEGKTLVSTLAGYLNALAGKGVHIVTVNDYLARRDSEWMGQIYKHMGLSVGLLQNGMSISSKRPAYESDVTYGTNSEFGFDYLRDNMVQRADLRVQRGHHFAIVDEVDSILIDEARTPLIISGAGTKSTSTYKDFARAVRGLTPEVDFEMDEAKHTITTTDVGLVKVERALNIDDIYADVTGQLVNHLQQALKAEYMFHKDQQYVVVDGEVKIVDEFTGRIMEGRRYSEGLHQAIEAKEGVLIREENQTLATITLQNYFRLYEKLAGMTGTAATEAAEFREIYNLDVQVIPPNKASARVDHDDLVYRTVEAKFNAVAEDVAARHAQGQPCLVGTVSIESSEKLSRILDKRGIQHSVLNAKHHEYEAEIVAQAGREGAVTIATNMAGRGTDILLGGNPEELARAYVRSHPLEDESDEDKEARYQEQLANFKVICDQEHQRVVDAGGLCVIGTERHESRRIDNQLRGRSGRQGDPGETQFYLSLEDDLMRLFGGDRMDRVAVWMERAEMPDDMPIQAKMVTKAVESAQHKVEEINFSMRKNVLDYDDVMNRQRQVIYEERNKILDGKDLVEHIAEVRHDTVERELSKYCSSELSSSDWDIDGLYDWLKDLTGKQDFPEVDASMSFEEILETVDSFVADAYDERAALVGEDVMHEFATRAMLSAIDQRWVSYLQEMDYLRTGIGLRGFGQRDPLVEYKSEAYQAFGELISYMYEDFLRIILRANIVVANAPETAGTAALQSATYSGPADVDGDQGSLASRAATAGVARVTNSPKPAQAPAVKAKTYRKDEDPNPYVGVGRNELCPCGSGKKFKNCHGKNA